MDILFLLVPVSVVLVFVIAGVFWWSLGHGQFEDMEGPAYRILMDDDDPRSANPTGQQPDAQPGTDAPAAPRK